MAAPTVFLAAGNAEVAWRTTGGSCAGEPARIQTTIDEGRTWDTRSTGSFDARRILALQVESPDVGSIVADVTAACTRTTLQSFTGGEFWRDAPALTATTAYVDPAEPGTVQLVQGPRDAPCDDAVQVVDSGQAAAVLCGSGALHIRSGSGDFRLIDAPGVLALALGTDGILTAGTAGSCAGTSVGRIVPASGAVSVLGCAAAAPTSGSVALSAAGRDVWLLTGDLSASPPTAGPPGDLGDRPRAVAASTPCSAPLDASPCRDGRRRRDRRHPRPLDRVGRRPRPPRARELEQAVPLASSVQSDLLAGDSAGASADVAQLRDHSARAVSLTGIRSGPSPSTCRSWVPTSAPSARSPASSTGSAETRCSPSSASPARSTSRASRRRTGGSTSTRSWQRKSPSARPTTRSTRR